MRHALAPIAQRFTCAAQDRCASIGCASIGHLRRFPALPRFHYLFLLYLLAMSSNHFPSFTCLRLLGSLSRGITFCQWCSYQSIRWSIEMKGYFAHNLFAMTDMTYLSLLLYHSKVYKLCKVLRCHSLCLRSRQSCARRIQSKKSHFLYSTCVRYTLSGLL